MSIFPGVVVVPVDGDLDELTKAMDKLTHEWEMRAARGECAWVCADCCMTFPDGMPDECAHGHQSCTDICKRDKAAALHRTPHPVEPDQP